MEISDELARAPCQPGSGPRGDVQAGEAVYICGGMGVGL